MKSKILLFFGFAICVALNTKAQFQKGDWLLGGNLGFSTDNSSPGNTTYSNSNIAPHIAMAIGNHSEIGLDLILSYSSSSFKSSDLFISTNLFYKRYFVLKNKLGWYLQFNGGIGWSKNVYNSADSAGNMILSTDESKVYNLGITPGIYYQLTHRILLDVDIAGLVYNYENDGGGYSTSSLSFNLLKDFTFGVDFIL